jgi:hypothetical protein
MVDIASIREDDVIEKITAVVVHEPLDHRRGDIFSMRLRTIGPPFAVAFILLATREA